MRTELEQLPNGPATRLLYAGSLFLRRARMGRELGAAPKSLRSLVNRILNAAARSNRRSAREAQDLWRRIRRRPPVPPETAPGAVGDMRAVYTWLDKVARSTEEAAPLVWRVLMSQPDAEKPDRFLSMPVKLDKIPRNDEIDARVWRVLMSLPDAEKGDRSLITWADWLNQYRRRDTA
jgi:hypothetical protein